MIEQELPQNCLQCEHFEWFKDYPICAFKKPGRLVDFEFKSKMDMDCHLDKKPSNNALTVILKQFQATGDVEQAKEDITGIMSSALEDTFEDTCSKCRKDETHYLVPKDLLRTTYAKIEGIIIDKNLHPGECGYTAEIWTVRQKLWEILKYGD